MTARERESVRERALTYPCDQPRGALPGQRLPHLQHRPTPQRDQQNPGEQTATEPVLLPRARTRTARAAPDRLLGKPSPSPPSSSRVLCLSRPTPASRASDTRLLPVYSCLRGWPVTPQNTIPLVTATDTALAHRETVQLQQRPRRSPARPDSSLPASPLGASLGHLPSCPASAGPGDVESSGAQHTHVARDKGQG